MTLSYFLRKCLVLVAVSFALAGAGSPGRAETIQSVTEMSYDAAGRALCTAIRMNPSTWGTPTDACVLETVGTAGPDRITKSLYDAAGRLAQTRRAVGTAIEQAYVTYAYNGSGKAIATLDANGNRSTQAYDGINRLVNWTFPSNQVPAAYNASLVLVTTQPSSVTYMCDDGLTLVQGGCNATVTQPTIGTNQCVITYTLTYNGSYYYCSKNIRIAARAIYTCPDGYYPTGNTCSQTTASVTAGAANQADYEQYAYDPNGNRTSLRKRDGRTFTFTFDALNRMTSKIVPDQCAPITGSAGATAPCPPASATRDVYYGYDLLGRQLFARFDSPNGDGVINSYDFLGRLTSSTQQMNGVSRSLSFVYDPNGNRTQLVFPDSQSFAFGYDASNRMKGIDVGSSYVSGSLTNIAYNSVGLRSNLVLGTDAVAYAYDPALRLQTLTHSFAGGAGNLSEALAYNPASQIVSETRNNTAYVFTGEYDVTRNYAANGLNQYTSAGPASFLYDANGNLVSDGSVIYGYDAENRIISVSGAKNATLSYDPLGRLYSVNSSTGTSTRFVYDTGMGAAAGVDALLAEYDGITNAMLRRYVHGPGLDEPLVWFEGTGLNDRRALHANHQGSIIAIANAAGSNIGIDSYDPYGIPGTGNSGRFQYTGQIWLAELGLYHYKARAYSPTLGRFLQTDPIGVNDDLNLYAYVGNDPLNAIDPSGEAGEGPNDPNCWIDCNPGRGRDRSNQPVIVDLHQHESYGGHTIQRHVGKSQAYLKNRLTNPLFRTYIATIFRKRAGSFSSLKSAQSLINSTISANRNTVMQVATGERDTAVITARFNSITGVEAYRNNNNSPVIFNNAYGVQVVIEHAPDVPGGFVVVTGFPTTNTKAAPGVDD